MVEDANFTQQYIIYSWVFLAVIFLARKEVRGESNDLGHSSVDDGQLRARRLDGLEQ